MVFITRLRDHKIFSSLHGQGLKALALKGSVWTTAGFGAQKILQLGSNLILTRLLFPEAFGLMALVNVFMVGLAMFSDVGIKPAIIQNIRGEEPAFLNTAWSIQVFRGFALWAVALLIAYPVAVLYEQPLLFPLLCAVGSTAAINGFASTAIITANRKLRFAQITTIQLAGQMVSIAAMVLLAWLYESVWALVIGGIVGALAQTILGYIVLPGHRHRLRIEREAFDAILKFGRWIFLATLVTFFGTQGIRVIEGMLVSPADLGILYIASVFALAFGELTTKILHSIGFPALSKIAREDSGRVAAVLYRIRIRILAPTLPAIIGLSLISSPLIDLLYDDRYSAAGAYIAIMAITSAIAMVTMTYQFAFMAIGDSRTHFILVTCLTIFRVSGLFTGFHLGGIIGMLIGVGVGTLALYVAVAIFAYLKGWFSPRVDMIAMAVILCGAWATYFWNV